MRARQPALRRRQGRRHASIRALSAGELQRVTRRFTTELQGIIGPDVDIPAPDVGTNAQTMAWIMDTVSMHAGYTVPGVVTGKPVGLGGSEGRADATGMGVMFTAERALAEAGIDSRARRWPSRASATSARRRPGSSMSAAAGSSPSPMSAVASRIPPGSTRPG